MPKSLLAVDDSVTMRKVIEMTFAGEDIKVHTVASAQDALAACRKEAPDCVLADVSLDGHSGYDLCRSIKDEFQGLPVILLSSKQNPFDPARAQASGADDHIDKPYDTAKAIELVKKVLAQGRAVAPAPIAAAAQPAAAAPAARQPMFTPATPAVKPIAPAAPAAPAITAKPAAAPTPHATSPGMPQPAARPAAATPPAAALQRNPTPALRASGTVAMPSDAPPAATVAAAHAQAAAPAPSGAGNGHALPAELSKKLGELGLSPAQVDAVLALSREVVERVVWEVVPVLAETMVKEEIARLTRE